MKIDLYVVPTVAILYLFCFIDVSGHTILRERLQAFGVEIEI